MTQTFSPGFDDAPVEAARAFRACLNAMARPGTIEHLASPCPPAPLSHAAGAVILTLCDPDTGIHLAGACACEAVSGWITFHTGAPVVSRPKARFAVGAWADLLPLRDYAIGTPDYPDRSATLIVECDRLSPTGTRLRGPGIRDAALLSLPEETAFRANADLFPLGLDFFFTAGSDLAALPRTTRVG